MEALKTIWRSRELKFLLENIIKERLSTPEEFFRINKPLMDQDGEIADTRALVVEEFNERFVVRIVI